MGSMTSHVLLHHLRVNCTTLLTSLSCQGWTDDMARHADSAA